MAKAGKQKSHSKKKGKRGNLGKMVLPAVGAAGALGAYHLLTRDADNASTEATSTSTGRVSIPVSRKATSTPTGHVSIPASTRDPAPQSSSSLNIPTLPDKTEGSVPSAAGTLPGGSRWADPAAGMNREDEKRLWEYVNSRRLPGANMNVFNKFQKTMNDMREKRNDDRAMERGRPKVPEFSFPPEVLDARYELDRIRQREYIKALKEFAGRSSSQRRRNTKKSKSTRRKRSFRQKSKCRKRSKK